MRKLLGYGMVACSLALVACGAAFLWGPLRQVLLAPVVIVLGCAAYVVARTYQYVTRTEG